MGLGDDKYSFGKVLSLTGRYEGGWEGRPTAQGWTWELLAQRAIIMMMKTNGRCLGWGTGKNWRQILFFSPC